MNEPFGSDAAAALRRLAQLSILFAIASLVVTAESLTLLPDASSSGRWIVVTVGAIVSVFAFALGVMIAVRSPLARWTGFATVAAIIPAAVLFSLLAAAVPQLAWTFSGWTVVLLAYAAFTTNRLVRWPIGSPSDPPKSTLAIFISYRRQDSHETAGRIHDHLLQAFEEKHIFLDVDHQPAGADYRHEIRRALGRADVLLVVIGTRWLTVVDRDGRRRLDDPEDMVRIEIETAFERRLRVIPILVESAGMPSTVDVPPSLRQLCYRTAVPVRPDPDFRRDMQRLMVALRESEEPAPDDEAMTA